MSNTALIFAFMVAVITYCVTRTCFAEMFACSPLMSFAVAALTFLSLSNMDIGRAILCQYAALGITLLCIFVLMFLMALFKTNRDVQKLEPKHDLTKRDEDNESV